MKYPEIHKYTHIQVKVEQMLDNIQFIDVSLLIW